MTDCAASLYLLVLLNGLPYGEVCTTSNNALPVAAIVQNVMGLANPNCPQSGTLDDLVACAPSLAPTWGGTSLAPLRLHYDASQ